MFFKLIPLSITGSKPVPTDKPFIGILKQTYTINEKLSHEGWERSSTYVAGISIVISTDAILALLNTVGYRKHIASIGQNMRNYSPIMF